MAVNGPSILNSAKKVLLKFFQYSTAITADILTAYRALHISELSQSLSRFFWCSNPDDPNTMTECCWLRATYGSAPTSIFMEIALREQVGGATDDEEVKELLNDSRFVDDLCASDHNPTRLVANMKSYIDICSKFGFTHGEVSSTNNIYEGTEQNQVRTLLGIEWNPALDVWRPNSEWNVSAKTRGIYKDRSVKEMSNDDLENLEVTKTLLSRLLGQTHEPTEKTYSPLLICLKILGRRASKLTSKWNEPISDEELHTELVKILKHIRDTPILPQDRAVIPKNHRLAKLNVSGDGSEPAASNTLHAR